MKNILKYHTHALALTVGVLGFSGTADGQLLNEEAPVIVGHYHLNVTSIEEHKRFWVETLGGVPITLGSEQAIQFPDVYLILRVQPPTGPTRGTPFDHIGFAVPDVPAVTERVVAAGYTLTVGREPPPGETASPPTAGNYGRFSYLLGPDGVKVELVTSSEENPLPIQHHHVHFVNPQFVQMQQWYMKAFDATLRPGQTDFFIGADLPGVGYMLNFFLWEPRQDLVPTAGRAVDHVGFEVRDLEAFLAGMEGKGIEVIQPFRRSSELGRIATAAIRDPWGTSIVLTEGLRDLN